MSKFKYSPSPKKRPYASGSCDDSSDSETETLAKQRKLNGAYGDNEPFLQKLKNFFYWIKDLPVKQFFISTVRMGSAPDVILLEEDDNLSNQTNNGESEFLKDSNLSICARLKLNNFLTLPLLNQSSLDVYENSNDSGTPHTIDSTSKFIKPGSEFIASKCNEDFRKLHISHSLLNNSQSAYPITRGSSRKMAKSKKTSSKPHIKKSHMDLTNDIEVLFDSRNPKSSAEAVVMDSDDIEIVSEISSPKPSSYSLQRKKELAPGPKSSTSIKQPSGPSKTESKYHSSFTAHEVVKLQEKEQYKLLLEKYTSGPLYQPTLKRLATDPNNEKEPFIGGPRAFSKETLSQPVTSFLEKYMRPCQLLEHTSSSAVSSSKKPARPKVIDVDDDEPIILQANVTLPQLKPLPMSKHDYFSPEWISDLKISVSEDTKERMKIVKEQEHQIEEHRKKRAALRAAEKQKREHLRIKGIVLPESGSEDDMTADFFELTPEMEQVIDNALMLTDRNKLLSSKDGFTVLRKDIETLQGLNWLNDEVINYYLALVVERGKLDNYPSVHSFNSFFYPNLKSKGFSSIRRWTRKEDIFSYDINLVPLHLGVHWCLATIDHRYKKIRYYDSMGGSEEICLEILRDYLVQEKRDKKSEDLDPSTYSIEVMKDIPNQMNGSDCGMFTLKYAEYITRDAEITFTQKNMQYFRRRMVYEILQNQLL